MSNRLRRVLAAALLSVLIAGVFLPAPASAQIPVTDVLNLAQAVLAWYQRFEAIQIKYQQLRSLQKQLESLGQGGDFNSLNGILGQLDQIFAVGENLGYLLAGVDDVFEETFPGYEAPVVWSEEYQRRVRRSRDTLHLITRALNRLTWANTRSQTMLDRITSWSRAADSPLEELEVQSMWQSLAVTEAQRSLQAQMLTANAVTVLAASQIQREASAEAARSAWLAREPTPEAGYDPSDGFTGIPDSWPWSF